MFFLPRTIFRISKFHFDGVRSKQRVTALRLVGFEESRLKGSSAAYKRFERMLEREGIIPKKAEPRMRRKKKEEPPAEIDTATLDKE